MAAPENTDDRRRSDLERVAERMRARGDDFTRAVADLLDDVADDHKRGMCGACEDGGQCATTVYVDRVAFAWLLAQLNA